MDEIVADRHANAENHAVGEALEHRFHVSLRLRVEASIKVGRIIFLEAYAGSEGVSVIVFEDTAGRVDSAVDVALVADIGKVERADDVGANGFGLVVLTPVDVGAASDARGHKNVRGFHGVEFLGHRLAVFDASFGEDDFNIVLLEKDGHLTADPAGFATIDESFC